MLAKIPNPSAGKTFSNEPKAQLAVCRTIADVLNREFDPGLIDVSDDAAGICRQVYKIAHGLSTGMHMEFLEVHSSLRRTLQNLQVWHEVLRELRQRVKHLAQSADGYSEPHGPERMEEYFAAIDGVEREHDQQMALLTSILDVELNDPAQELKRALAGLDSEFHSVKKKKLEPGSEALSDALAHSLGALGTTARVSATVDNALRKVGLSVEEYQRSSSAPELEDRLRGLLASRDWSDSSTIAEHIRAAKALKASFGHRSQLSGSGDGMNAVPARQRRIVLGRRWGVRPADAGRLRP